MVFKHYSFTCRASFSVCLSVWRMENCTPSSPGTNHKKFKFSHFDVSIGKCGFKDFAFVFGLFAHTHTHIFFWWRSLSEFYRCCWLQVQSLIKQEVRSAMEKNEAKLKSLLETIEHLDRNTDYESTIQKLEVGSRGQRVWSHVLQLRNIPLLLLQLHLKHLSIFLIPSLCFKISSRHEVIFGES